MKKSPVNSQSSGPSCGINSQSTPPKPSKPKTPLFLKLAEWFGLDIRSLALFRMGLALVLIADLINRATDLRAHYTDFGVLPRGVLLDKFANEWYLSIHFLSGTWQVMALIFLINGLIAVSFFVGYRTWLCTVLLWFLNISLQARNPMVLQGGDIYLRLILFWAMFLPLGAAYSVDRALNSSTNPIPQRIFNFGSVAMTMQFVMVYTFTALLKQHPIWLKEYSAVYYALNIDQHATVFGTMLLAYPTLLKCMTYMTLKLEFFGPMFLFAPALSGPIRTAVVFSFMLLHLSFSLFLEIGLFSAIAAVGWSVLLPSWFWEKNQNQMRKTARQGVKIYFDADCGFCKKMALLIQTFLLFDENQVKPAYEDAKIQADLIAKNSWIVVDAEGKRHYEFEALIYLMSVTPVFWLLAKILRVSFFTDLGTKAYKKVADNRMKVSRLTTPLTYRPLKTKLSIVGNVLAVFFLLYAFTWNLTTIERYKVSIPQNLRWIGFLTRIEQRWNMFAPYPLKDDGWYVISGKLKDGTDVNVLTGKEGLVSFDKPAVVSAMYPNDRWRKYMMNIWAKSNADHRLYYGRYLCRSWNEVHRGRKQLNTFSIDFMEEDTLPDYQPPIVKKVNIWNHECFKKTTD